jgi:hypothetical protein
MNSWHCTNKVWIMRSCLLAPVPQSRRSPSAFGLQVARYSQMPWNTSSDFVVRDSVGPVICRGMGLLRVGSSELYWVPSQRLLLARPGSWVLPKQVSSLASHCSALSSSSSARSTSLVGRSEN